MDAYSLILVKLATACSDPVNTIFGIVILTVSIFGTILTVGNKLHNLRDFLPYLCGTLGIFGTFLGIFVGLSDFDSYNISKSIPPLLDGMKIAFFSSIVGMIGTIWLKLIYAVYDCIHIQGEKDVIAILKNIELSSINTNREMEKLSETLNKCFKSDEEYSLVSQVRLIRQEMSDNSRRMEKQFSEFMEYFSKMASESLVNELTKVIDKFNAMLNDLVSQSFIDLKNSTERLNQWQAEYKDTLQQQHENLSSLLAQISSLNTLFNESVQRVETLSVEIDSIDGSLSSITLSGENLERITEMLNRQNQSLDASLQAIAQTGEQAKTAIPAISQGFSKISEQMRLMLAQVDEFVISLGESLKSHAKEFQSSCQEQVNTIGVTIHSVSDKIAKIDNKHSEAVRKMIEDFNRHYENVQRTSEEQIKSIEQALQKELTESLEKFVGSIVLLSKQFASDYLPLTERLREILRIAEGVR